MLTIARRIFHDIKSPLGAVLSAGDLVAEVLQENSGQQELAMPIVESAENILRIVNRVQEVLFASATPAEFAPLDASRLTDLMRPLVAIPPQKKLSIGTDFPTVSAVPEYLTIAVRELLDNAVLHGGDEISAGCDSDGKGGFTLWVRDNGPGLSAAREARVFPAFEALHSLKAVKGIGLALVRRFAELQGGTVAYRKCDSGVEFSISIARSEAPTIPPQTDTACVPDIWKLDDERRLRALVAGGLMDTPAEPEFDFITAMVRRVLHVPLALFTLVDKDREFSKSASSQTDTFLKEQANAAFDSVARSVVERNAAVVVHASSETALPGFESQKIRAYIGVPVHSPTGEPIGALCAFGCTDQRWSDEDLDTLNHLSKLIRNELRLRYKRALVEEMEGRIQRDERLAMSLMEFSGDCIKILDPKGGLLDMNRPGRCLMEIADIRPLVGLPWPTLWPESSRHLADAALGEAMQGRPARFQGFCPTQGGTPKWWDVAVTAIRDVSGNVANFLAISRDITVEKQVEFKIRASEDRLRKLLDTIPLSVAMLNTQGSVVQVNNAIRQIGHIDGSADMLGHHITKLRWWIAHPAEREKLASEIELVAFGGSVRRESMVTMPDGRQTQVELIMLPIFSEDGQVTHIVLSALDLSERIAAQRALADGEVRFRTLANNISQLAWMANADGELSWYNQRWFDFTGTTYEDVKGSGWQRVHHPEHVGRVTEKFRQCVADGTFWEDTFPLRSKNGGYRWFLSRAIPVRDDVGKITRWFGTNTDITDQLETEEALRKAVTAKDEFIAILSHELRTPLNPVLLIASEAVTREDLPATVRADFEIIRKSIEAEARLIDDLLDITRISRGKISLIVSTVSVDALLGEMLPSIRSAAAAKGVHIVAPAMVPNRLIVQGDDMRIRQVLWNIIGNAIKFTPTGGTVKIDTAMTDQEVRITIADSGIGMSEEELARVFEPFQQGDHAGKKPGTPEGASFGGLGLGLYISRTLVKMHGGDITAESPGGGKGTRFVVSIPMGSELPAAVEISDMPPVQSVQTSEGPMRILLVEDHDATRTTLTMLLQRRGHVVESAATLAAAREAYNRGKFDLLMSDIGLPDGRGDELMAELVSRGNAPFGVALSGYGMEADIKRSRAAGFMMHLTKPVSLAELDRALRKVSAARCT